MPMYIEMRNANCVCDPRIPLPETYPGDKLTKVCQVLCSGAFLAVSIKFFQDILRIKFFATTPRARASRFAHRNLVKAREKNKVQKNPSFLRQCWLCLRRPHALTLAFILPALTPSLKGLGSWCWSPNSQSTASFMAPEEGTETILASSKQALC